MVIIPEEYYSGDALQPKHAEPCKVSSPEDRLCLMYSYINIENLYSVQGESGTNSKGYGNDLVSKTNVYDDPDILLQLPVINTMAELSRNQVEISSETVVRRCSIIKLFLKILQNPLENTCTRVLTLLKKKLWHRCFNVNFTKFLRIPIFMEHLWWLFLLV